MMACCTGVLQGAIDYYILDKFQRLTNTKAYTKVGRNHEPVLVLISAKYMQSMPRRPPNHVRVWKVLIF